MFCRKSNVSVEAPSMIVAIAKLVLGGGRIWSLARLVVIGLVLTRLRDRPPPIVFLQPPGAPVPL
jgi:hypothetical protein